MIAQAIVNTIKLQQQPPLSYVYNIDYLQSSKATHYSQKSSISKNQLQIQQLSMQQHQQQLSGAKDVSKRSGTTGGTESKNNLMKPFLSEMDTNLQQLMSTSNNAITKQGSKKGGRQLVSNSRNAVAAKMEQLRA